MYVCTYVPMHALTHVHMQVYMQVCMHVRTYVPTYVRTVAQKHDACTVRGLRSRSVLGNVHVALAGRCRRQARTWGHKFFKCRAGVHEKFVSVLMMYPRSWQVTCRHSNCTSSCMTCTAALLYSVSSLWPHEDPLPILVRSQHRCCLWTPVMCAALLNTQHPAPT